MDLRQGTGRHGTPVWDSPLARAANRGRAGDLGAALAKGRTTTPAPHKISRDNSQGSDVEQENNEPGSTRRTWTLLTFRMRLL